jgi:predicted nucleotidyltransferase
MITGSGNGASQNPAYRPSPAFSLRGSSKLIEVRRVDRKSTIAQDKLDLIIRRIVEVAKPEKIILFGSAARGAMGPNSDVDLLVIKSGANRLDLMGEIYRNLHGVGEPVDVIVATPEDVERYRNSFALAIYPAVREGKVVYAA